MRASGSPSHLLVTLPADGLDDPLRDESILRAAVSGVARVAADAADGYSVMVAEGVIGGRRGPFALGRSGERGLIARVDGPGRHRRASGQRGRSGRAAGHWSLEDRTVALAALGVPEGEFHAGGLL